MAPQVYFDRVSDFQITGSNFGKVGGDFTTTTLHSSNLESLNRLHKRRSRRRSRRNGQTFQEPVAGTTPVRIPVPLASTVRPPPHSNTGFSNSGFPHDQNGGNSANHSPPLSSDAHQLQPRPSRSPSSNQLLPPRELSPLTDALGLRRFTPTPSETIVSHEERRNTPSLRVSPLHTVHLL